MVKKAKILRATKLTNHVYHANVYDRYIFNVYCSCIQELRTTADSLFYAITLKYCKNDIKSQENESYYRSGCDDSLYLPVTFFFR